MTSQATVTLPFAELQEHITARQQAENKLAAIEKELIAARFSAGTDPSMVKALNELAWNAVAVARFAVAQLPPEAHKHWPAEELRVVAKLLPMLIEYTAPEHGPLAAELLAFADEVDRWEDYRKKRPKVSTAVPTRRTIQADGTEAAIDKIDNDQLDVYDAEEKAFAEHGIVRADK